MADYSDPKKDVPKEVPPKAEPYFAEFDSLEHPMRPDVTPGWVTDTLSAIIKKQSSGWAETPQKISYDWITESNPEIPKTFTARYPIVDGAILETGAYLYCNTDERGPLCIAGPQYPYHADTGLSRDIAYICLTHEESEYKVTLSDIDPHLTIKGELYLFLGNPNANIGLWQVVKLHEDSNGEFVAKLDPSFVAGLAEIKRLSANPSFPNDEGYIFCYAVTDSCEDAECGQDLVGFIKEREKQREEESRKFLERNREQLEQMDPLHPGPRRWNIDDIVKPKVNWYSFYTGKFPSLKEDK